MHIKSLKVFCDVVGKRSFSRAADENGISQSGASQMIHQLEDHLGVRLIDRSKRPLVLTEEGNVYYNGCRELVKRLLALEEEVRTLHQEVEGSVSVAAIYSVGLTYLNGFSQDFRYENSKAELRLRYEHPDRVYELVESDQVDLGLVSYAKSSRSIKSIPWCNEPIVFVCSSEHRLAGNQPIDLADLDGLDTVGFDPNLGIRRKIDRSLSALGVTMNTVLEFDNIETIKRAIEINQSAALLPAPTVVNEVKTGTLAVRPVRGAELSRPLGIIHRRGVELKKTVRKFFDVLHCHPQAGASSSAEDNGSTTTKQSADEKLA